MVSSVYVRRADCRLEIAVLLHFIKLNRAAIQGHWRSSYNYLVIV